MKQTVAHPCGNQYVLRQKLSALALLNASACALVIKRKSRPRVTSIRETLLLSWHTGACIVCREPRSAGGSNRQYGRATAIDCLQACCAPVCSPVLRAQPSCCMGRGQRVLFAADGRSRLFA